MSDCTSFTPTAKLLIPTGRPTNEVKGEIETYSLTSETKQKTPQNNSKPHTLCYAFQSWNNYIFLRYNFMFHLPF